MNRLMRTATCNRLTAATEITLSLDLDGTGKSDIETGVGFLDHMLTLFSRHARIDLTVRCAGDTSLQQTKKKSDIRFWMSLCLLLTGHWYLPAGLCTVSQIEVSPLCSCTYSLICGYVAPFWNPDISIFSNENSTRTFFESISPLERRTTVSEKLVRSSPVGLGAI